MRLRIDGDIVSGHEDGAVVSGVLRDVAYLAERLDAEDRATLRAALAEVLAEPLTVKPMTDVERACYDREFREKLLAEHPAEPERPWAVGDECEFIVRGKIAELRENDANVEPIGLLVEFGCDVRFSRFHRDLSDLRRPGGAS